jgi:Glycosyl transferase family 2
MISSLSKQIALRVARKGQFVAVPLKKAYKTYKQEIPKVTYNAWIVESQNSCYVRKDPNQKPFISVIVPAYNTEPSHFLAMVYSVINQDYANWELVIVNASDNGEAKQRVAAATDIDTRIKVVTPDKNLGIAGNTNFGIKHCSGDYIAFLDHDDLLHKCALHSMAAAISQTGAGIVYSDEDKIKDDSSMFFDPFFKPKWSPDLFENVNYINHLTVIKTEHIRRVKALRPKFDGAQDYDLLLRVIDICKPRIEHVSRVLYHWRAASTSTASDFSTKTYVMKAGQSALREHLERQGVKGSTKPMPNLPGFYRTIPETPRKISLVIGPVDQSNHHLCVAWLKELSKQIDNGIETQLVIGDWLKRRDLGNSFSSVKYIEGRDDTYWQTAAKAADEPVVLCFGIAALPYDKHAISEIIAQASTGQTVVAPFVVGGDNTILDAGLVESEHGKQRLFTGCRLGDSTYYGYTGFVRNVAGLTLDIFAASRGKFVELTANKHGSTLTDIDLDKIKSHDTRLIVNPRAPLDFKGALTLDKFMNDQYFNPQLMQAHTDLYVKVSSWGNLKDVSERDNAE